MYDNSKEKKIIMCMDQGNLYGWAMSQYLQYSGIKWLHWREIKRFDVTSVDENSPIGYR